VPGRIRLGAQPWEATYKSGVLATGDFAGVHNTIQWAPMIRSNFTFAQIEESSTGPTDNFIRGDDVAFIGSVEITPFKGLDIRPIVSYAELYGITGQARLGRGGVSNTAGFFPAPGTAGIAAGAVETRWTVGVDARWRFGAFSLDPTVMYQGGTRDIVPTGGVLVEQRRSAWLADLRAGWQAGPLLIEAAGIYTTGNKAGDDIAGGTNMDFYEPISTDSGFYGTWAEIWALNIDYFNSLRPRAAGVNTITSIGYDKYGLIRAGVRASYALTPAFTLRTAATANWTAEDVDTSSTLTNAGGLAPGDGSGDTRYLGTELNLGFQWRFAPNVAFDTVASYMFAGNALATHLTTNNAGVARNGRNPQDIQAVSARIRYSF
jgi:hypothetical protein